MAEDMVVVKAGELKAMTVKKLTEAGMTAADAGIVADVLIFAELRGVGSHGVIRVEHYCNRIRAGGINLKADFVIDMVKPTIGRLDAKGGMGHVATHKATVEALRIAKKEGMALMGILNNSHNGALAYYVQMALDAKLASLVCVNVNSLVAPFGGGKPFLGSNPLAFGFPGRKEEILLDMASSEVAWGKILTSRATGKPLAPNWAVDADGHPTTDADKAVALTPFGGAKGSGINIMIEALTGLLVGGVFGPHLKDMYSGLNEYRNLAAFILVIDPSVFGGNDHYLDVAQAMIDELHAQPPAPGFTQVMVPGDIEKRNRKTRETEGIPVPKDIYDYLAK